MAAEIEAGGIGKVLGITRHQNFVHPEIKYTSHNSSACLRVDALNMNTLKDFCRDFLLRIAPEGSDIGLCIANENKVPESIIRWGLNAKQIVLYQDDARKLAAETGIYLEGLTGSQDGVIGALAAVGLRKYGNDGRFIWLRGKKELREINTSVYSREDLEKDFGIEQLVDIEGTLWLNDEQVHITDWFRPVMKDNQVTLIVEKQIDNGQHFWQVAGKDFIRANS